MYICLCASPVNSNVYQYYLDNRIIYMYIIRVYIHAYVHGCTVMFRYVSEGSLEIHGNFILGKIYTWISKLLLH